HVVDPAHRVPPWVIHELKKKAIEQACVEPILKQRGLAPGSSPEVEDRIRREATDRALANAKGTPTSELTVMLPKGVKLKAEVEKFGPPLLLDMSGKPLSDSGRDLALLRVQDGVYPALAITSTEPKVGDDVRVLGFPGVVLSHELLSKSVALDPVVTNG